MALSCSLFSEGPGSICRRQGQEENKIQDWKKFLPRCISGEKNFLLRQKLIKKNSWPRQLVWTTPANIKFLDWIKLAETWLHGWKVQLQLIYWSLGAWCLNKTVTVLVLLNLSLIISYYSTLPCSTLLVFTSCQTILDLTILKYWPTFDWMTLILTSLDMTWLALILTSFDMTWQSEVESGRVESIGID